MPLRLGIGVATYNRRDVLARSLDAIQRHTRYPFAVVAVADDGSTDGTMEMLRVRGVTAVTGRNMGIAWNKNRALFLLAELLLCDIVILLEDDTYPTQDNWELDWMNGALRWGHANLAAEWRSDTFLSGTGAPDDPVRSTALTAQCSVFTREALLFGGYFDTRFHGYGHEHVEHSARLAKAGYGGAIESLPDGRRAIVFLLLRGALAFTWAPSARDQEQEARNAELCRRLFGDDSPRRPWRDANELRQFREEMRAVCPPVPAWTGGHPLRR